MAKNFEIELDIDRSLEFFDRKISKISKGLTQKIVVLDKTDQAVVLTELEEFKNVGQRYKGISELIPGDVWTPYRRTTQFLVVTPKEGQLGSCVRVVRAARFDSNADHFIHFKREGDLATYFQLKHDDRGKLRFIKGSNILCLTDGDSERATLAFDPFKANFELNKLLGI